MNMTRAEHTELFELIEANMHKIEQWSVQLNDYWLREEFITWLKDNLANPYLSNSSDKFTFFTEDDFTIAKQKLVEIKLTYSVDTI